MADSARAHTTVKKAQAVNTAVSQTCHGWPIEYTRINTAHIFFPCVSRRIHKTTTLPSPQAYAMCVCVCVWGGGIHVNRTRTLGGVGNFPPAVVVTLTFLPGFQRLRSYR